MKSTYLPLAFVLALAVTGCRANPPEGNAPKEVGVAVTKAPASADSTTVVGFWADNEGEGSAKYLVVPQAQGSLASFELMRFSSTGASQDRSEDELEDFPLFRVTATPSQEGYTVSRETPVEESYEWGGDGVSPPSNPAGPFPAGLSTMSEVAEGLAKLSRSASGESGLKARAYLQAGGSEVELVVAADGPGASARWYVLRCRPESADIDAQVMGVMTQASGAPVCEVLLGIDGNQPVLRGIKMLAGSAP